MEEEGYWNSLEEGEDRCCCSWMPGFITGRSSLLCCALSVWLVALTLLALVLFGAATVDHELDLDYYIYLGPSTSSIMATGLSPDRVAYNPCGSPVIAFEGDSVPSYLNASACNTPVSCCPQGYALISSNNTNTNKSASTRSSELGYDGAMCSSTTYWCKSVADTRTCIRRLIDDSDVVEDVPYKGLLRLLQRKKAEWSFPLCYTLVSMATMIWIFQLCLWWRFAQARRSRFALRPSSLPSPYYDHHLSGHVYTKRESKTCLGVMLLGVILAALIITGGATATFASKPDIDGVSAFDGCFASFSLWDSLEMGYFFTFPLMMVAFLGSVFGLMGQALYVVPAAYNRLWNWKGICTVVVITAILSGTAVGVGLVETL